MFPIKSAVIDIHFISTGTVAYPELVSRGVSKSPKFKWLVKVGACKDVNPLIKKKTWPGGGGGFRATRKPPWIRHCWNELIVLVLNVAESQLCCQDPFLLMCSLQMQYQV